MLGRRPNPFAFRGFTVAIYLTALAGCVTDGSTAAPDVTPASTPVSGTSSAPAATSPPSSVPPVNVALPAPAATPGSLSAISGNATVSLTWTASSGATSYSVKRATTTSGPYTQLATTTSAAYADSTVSNGTTYYYVVDAINSVGTSADSAQALASPSAPPAKVVTGCNGLPAVGVWQQITPAAVDLSTFGVIKVSIVPTNTAVVYMGTTKSGMFKSTDCGANFVQVNTGTLGAQISVGATYPLIDPINPNVVYTYSLYGQNGFFKSTDSGVNFVSVLTPAVSQYAPYGGFVGGADIDPQNHLHLLVSWHDVCAAPYNSSCYAETLDGGVTWVLRNGDPSWQGGEGTTLNFLDSNRWLFSSQSNGMWLSVDRGTTWTQIPMAQVAHGTGQLVRMSDGSFFMAAQNGVLYSPDGVTWNPLPNSGTLNTGLATDGQTLWTSQAFPYNPNQRPAPAQRYWQGSISNPNSWAQMSAPNLSSGGVWLTYDPDHHILYSANFWDGLWRVVVK